MSKLSLDLSAAIRASDNRRQCSVCATLARMTLEEGESLRQALESKVGAKRLSIILQKHGVEVGVPSIHRHRSEGHQT
jgi:hypothetical protein